MHQNSAQVLVQVLERFRLCYWNPQQLEIRHLTRHDPGEGSRTRSAEEEVVEVVRNFLWEFPVVIREVLHPGQAREELNIGNTRFFGDFSLRREEKRLPCFAVTLWRSNALVIFSLDEEERTLCRVVHDATSILVEGNPARR